MNTKAEIEQPVPEADQAPLPLKTPAPVPLVHLPSLPVMAAEGIKILTADDVPQPLSSSRAVYFRQLVIYPAKGCVAGVLTANDNDIRIGRSNLYQPDLRAAADVAYPVVYELPLGQKMLLSQIFMLGKTGDGVFYSYT